MSVPQIRLKVEGFRAISKANIIIDGITVVAGENGSGKSTLSKLLYYVFKTACNYEALVETELQKKLRDVERFLDIAIFEVSSFSNEKNSRNELEKELDDIYRSGGLLNIEKKERWENMIDKVSQSYFITIEKGKERETYRSRSRRLTHIINDLLKQKSKDEELTPEIFEKVKVLVKSYYQEALDKIESRPIDLFEQAIENAFMRTSVPKKVEVLEYESTIIATNQENLSKPYSILDTIYTDTPMSIGVDGSGNKYWDDLNVLLRKRSKGGFSDIASVINRIIKGEVSLEDDAIFASSEYSYKRADGNVFNLLDCATGIRALGILTLLLKNGSLNDKALLIIDEPEVHLHPQWIVEYARIIVLLNRDLGVKFFIASHDPDFVSAIRYISEKEGNLDKVHFYLAEEENTPYVYNYTHLDKEIDPIFKSFNKAIDRISEYGV